MLSKTIIGTLVGAVFAIVWGWLGFGWACLALGLAAAGAAIGYVIDRPGLLIEQLERLQRR